MLSLGFLSPPKDKALYRHGMNCERLLTTELSLQVHLSNAKEGALEGNISMCWRRARLALPPCSAVRMEDGMLHLCVHERLHTSGSSGIIRHASVSGRDWLNETVLGVLFVVKTTEPCVIKNTIQVHFTDVRKM